MNTMQFEFDAVVKHLYKQGRPAKYSAMCLYRTEHNGSTLSCAVGCRIPDSIYDSAMDAMLDTSVSCLVAGFDSVLPKEIGTYLPMFERLQQAHDRGLHTVKNGFDLEALEMDLTSIAAEFDLTFTKPKQGEE